MCSLTSSFLRVKEYRTKVEGKSALPRNRTGSFFKIDFISLVFKGLKYLYSISFEKELY